MKQFSSHRFDPVQCRLELDAFKALLDNNQNLGETAQISPFFETHLNIAVFVGELAYGIIEHDLVAHQLGLGGDFACDLATGDSKRLTYCLVEFEDAMEDSVFRKVGRKATRDWSPRFEHGFSQIVDWFYKLEDMKQSNAFEDLFGRNASHYGVLVAGRSHALQPGELTRLRWREQKVLIDSRRVFCLTYDELYAHLDSSWNRYDPGFYAKL